MILNPVSEQRPFSMQRIRSSQVITGLPFCVPVQHQIILALTSSMKFIRNLRPPRQSRSLKRLKSKKSSLLSYLIRFRSSLTQSGMSWNINGPFPVCMWPFIGIQRSLMRNTILQSKTKTLLPSTSKSSNLLLIRPQIFIIRSVTRGITS